MSEAETVDQTEPVKAPAQPEVAPIDPILIEKIATLRDIANIGNCLENAMFPGVAAADIVRAQQFIRAFHAPILKECQSHPDFARATQPPKPPEAPYVPTPADLAAQEKAELKRKRKEAQANRARSN